MTLSSSLSAFPQMCVMAIANLLQMSQKKNEQRNFFHKDRDIIPFIDCHWESMTTMPRRVTQSWHATVRSRVLSAIVSVVITLSLSIFRSFPGSQGVAERRWDAVHDGRKLYRGSGVRSSQSWIYVDQAELRSNDQRRSA